LPSISQRLIRVSRLEQPTEPAVDSRHLHSLSLLLAHPERECRAFLGRNIQAVDRGLVAVAGDVAVCGLPDEHSLRLMDPSHDWYMVRGATEAAGLAIA